MSISHQARTVAGAVYEPVSCALSGIQSDKVGLAKERAVNENELYVGIDVSKGSLDVAVRPTDERWKVANDETGIEQISFRLGEL